MLRLQCIEIAVNLLHDVLLFVVCFDMFENPAVFCKYPQNIWIGLKQSATSLRKTSYGWFTVITNIIMTICELGVGFN